MKRIFTLIALVTLFVSGADAQNLRKTWDFREGFSQKTVNALKGDQQEYGDNKYWRNYESDASQAKEERFWNASGDFKNADGFACTHNGGIESVIPELDGLVLGASAAKKFVICYNAPLADDELGDAPGGKVPYGSSHIWLNGKKETIKFQAEVNQKIRIAVESHAVNKSKLGEARGISLSTSTGTLELKDGNPVPTYYTECEWELTGNDGEIATLTIQSTNGCHIYYIIVGDGDDPDANKKKVAYLLAGSADSDPVYAQLKQKSDIVVTPIDVTTKSQSDYTLDFFRAYDATVIGSSVPTDNDVVAALKQHLAFLPVVNLNPALYAAWGYGEAVPTEDNIIEVKDTKNLLFTGAETIEEEGITGIVLSEEAAFTGVKLGEYFQGDDTPALGMFNKDAVAIHTHNIYHNGYVYLPFTNEMMQAVNPANAVLLDNAVDMITSSKSDITAVGAPHINVEYKDLNTNVSIEALPSSLPKIQIFYTTDGTEPTVESTKYEGTLNFTAPTTLKAVAIAEGYLLSDVATKEIEIKEQPKTPVITFDAQDGQSIVTIDEETPDVEIWYNFTEGNDTTKSMKYTEPFTLRENQTVTAFAVAGGQVFSETTTQRVVIKNAVVRIDPIAHFDANADAWNAKGEEAQTGSTTYYFSWSKSAVTVYDETQDPTIDDEGNITYTELRPYEVQLPINENQAGWQIKSRGQVMIYQVISVGKDPGNENGYNPATAADLSDLITKNDVQFGGKMSGEECTGAIETTVTYQAPFDIVSFIGTASGSEARMAIEVSTDQENWTQVGEEMTVDCPKRLWKKFTRSYEGTDQVYVRLRQAGGGSSVQCYDIYIMTDGEQSAILKQQMDEEYETVMGITNVAADAVKAKGIFNINGQRLAAPVKGINIIDGKKVVVK